MKLIPWLAIFVHAGSGVGTDIETPGNGNPAIGPGDEVMTGNSGMKWLRALAAGVMFGCMQFQGCAAGLLRDVADGINERADQLDGRDDSVQGFFADLIRDL